MSKILIRGAPLKMKPVVLGPDYHETNAMPKLFVDELTKHFELVTEDVYNKNPALYNDKIEAILPWFAKPIVTEEMVKSMPKLKIVASISAGYNHLDVPMLLRNKIRISNTPNVLNDATAEQAIALMLAAARNTVIGVQLAMGEEGPDLNINFHGRQFSGSTVGIVGMGRIGLTVAKRARGFDCEILYHNRRQRSDVDDLGATYYPKLEDMLPHCDFVCVVVALTKETRHLFKYEHFVMMKKTAVFCNVSRGDTVHQEGLVQALEEKQIYMAALDVTSPEPLPRGHPLLKQSNCIIVPHWGSATETTRLNMCKLAIENTLQALENKTELTSEVFE